MFFVGATGQLLTLILTVCLPFVFFISGHQNINLSNSSLKIEVRQVQHEVINHQVKVVAYDDLILAESQHRNFISEKYNQNKIPLREFIVKRRLFYIDSSGNKAPPVFHCFC